jgi:hypothetical protein
MANKPPKKPRMGRPPLPPGERLDKMLKIRFSASERQELDDAAKPDETSTWARRLLLKAAKRRK